MNKHFRLLILMAIVISTSCGGNKNKTADTEVSVASAESIKFRSAEGRRLEGLWIRDNFLRSLEKTKSIFASQIPPTDFLTLQFENTSTDSGLVICAANHAGAIPFQLRFDPTSKHFVTTSASDYFEEVEFPLQFMINDSGLLSFRGVLFRKTDDFIKTVNSLLIAGKYIDSATGHKIIFHEDGKVSGIDTILNYTLARDFVATPQYDFLSLYGKNNEPETYHWTIHEDTTRLFHVKVNWDSLEDTIEGLSYKLVRLR